MDGERVRGRMMLLLTAEELVELTGYLRPSHQRSWLTRNGIPHLVNAAGHPVVARTAAEARLGGRVAAPVVPELGPVR